MNFKNFLSLDCETTGLNLFHGCKPFAVSTCDHKGRTTFWEFPVDPVTRQPNIPEVSKQAIRKHIKDKILIYHNAKFDIRALQTIGIEVPFSPVEETLIASHILDSSESHRLKDLAAKYCDIPDDDEEELKAEVRRARRAAKKQGFPISEKVKMDYWLPKAINPKSIILKKYSVLDAIRTMKLAMVLLPEIEKQKFTKIYKREKALIEIIYRMEARGIILKPYSFQEMYKTLTKRRDKSEKMCCNVVNKRNMNIRSPQQIQTVIYKQLGCRVLRSTDKGTPSTDKVAITEHLERCKKKTSIRSRFLQYLLDYREAKTKCGYLDNYKSIAVKEDNTLVLHPSYNSTGTRFTRFSSSNPNGTNIDNELKNIFGPRKGHSWFCIDYSQIELRIFAVAAKEEKMLQAFSDGTDIHQITANAFGISRKIAKNINFAMIYGAGTNKIAEMAMMDGGKADNNILKETYPSVVKFMQKTQEEVRKNGYIYTLDGYRLAVDKDKPYIGVDAICQGTAGSLVKSAMVKTNQYLKNCKEVRLLLNIHDELIFEVQNSTLHCFWIETEIKRIITALANIMECVGVDMDTPVVTPVGVKRTKTSWADAKEYKI